MIKHEEVKDLLKRNEKSLHNKNICYYFTKEEFTKLQQYVTEQEKKDELLGLYQKAIRMMVCIPQNETYHYVVRYTDDTRFNSILNQIKKLEEELK